MVEKIMELLKSGQFTQRELGELLKELQQLTTLQEKMKKVLTDLLKDVNIDFKFLIVRNGGELKVEPYEEPSQKSNFVSPPLPSRSSKTMTVRIKLKDGQERVFNSGNEAKEFIAYLLREKYPNDDKVFQFILEITKHSNARITLTQYRETIMSYLPEIKEIEIE
jgi:hypothetical protein